MSWVRIESGVYWSVFVATFLAVAIWESFHARSTLSVAAGRRWRNHALLLTASTLVVQVLYRVSPVFLALAVANSRWGLLNKPWLPFAAKCVVAVLLMDFVKYAVHRACHSVAPLWRVHQVHHSDPDFDISTAFRVHPLEQVVMQGSYLAVVAIFAPPIAAIVVAEALAGFQSIFQHANASLPEWLERRVHGVLITPTFHRIHHSEEVAEQNSNFGEVFPWWDRLLGTYAAAPTAGPEMIMGLRGFQNAGSLGLAFMFRQPFLREKQ